MFRQQLSVPLIERNQVNFENFASKGQRPSDKSMTEGRTYKFSHQAYPCGSAESGENSSALAAGMLTLGFQPATFSRTITIEL